MYFRQPFSQSNEKLFYDNTFLSPGDLIAAPPIKNVFMSLATIILQSQLQLSVISYQLSVISYQLSVRVDSPRI